MIAAHAKPVRAGHIFIDGAPLHRYLRGSL